MLAKPFPRKPSVSVFLFPFMNLDCWDADFSHSFCVRLQDRDLRACQLLLQLPSGATFLGSTPELLYERSGSRVASEAVAATRPRGPPGVVSPTYPQHLLSVPRRA